MIVKADHLIADLIERTQINISQVKKFNSLPIEKLNWRIDQNSWSILECIEHLSLYGNFYIPEIKKTIETSKTLPKEKFKSGILGNFFAKSMLPKEKLNRMRTFKDKNPIGSELDKSTIQCFINQQEQIVNLLDKSKGIDLNRTKTAVSISEWIKLKLGDTFRVVVYHNERHILQAIRTSQKACKILR